LVLWDVDQTLVNVDGLGREAFDLAFRRVFGREPVTQPLMAGRTDRAIALDMMRDNGVPDGDLEALRAEAERALDELAHLLPVRGRALAGAAQALAAVFGRGTAQSLLTGNVRRFAEVKLAAFGLLTHLDLDIGGYGWADPVRARLVDIARAAALARLGVSFEGRRTVLVGDTPLDVEAALVSGASVLAVATGRYSAAELAAAGAHRVLPDLSDTGEVLDSLYFIAS
jgi:phosphoglycolate phosphatase